MNATLDGVEFTAQRFETTFQYLYHDFSNINIQITPMMTLDLSVEMVSRECNITTTIDSFSLLKTY